MMEMRHSTKEEQAEYGAMLEKISVGLHPIDRDALLALADECDEMRSDGLPIGSHEVYRIARRIREALGVEL